MTATITEPTTFAQLRKGAQQREEARLRAKEAAKAAEAQVQQAKRRLNTARDFGHRYETAVIRRLSSRELSAGQVDQVEQFVGAMLSPHDVELPQLGDKLATELKSMFVYGLELAERDGAPVPEGIFNGQRKLTEETAAAAVAVKPARLHIQSGDPRRRVGAKLVHSTSSTSVELKPAITPAGAKKKPKKG